MNKVVSDIIGENAVPIYTVSPEDSLVGAVGLMSSKHVGCLLVKKDGDYVGIITERDVTHCCARCDDFYESTVQDAMTCKLDFVRPDDTLEYAAHFMRKQGFRHLPVFKGDTLVHVLSIRDLAFAKLDELQSDIEVLADHVFSWELDGQKHDFYKDVMGKKSKSV